MAKSSRASTRKANNQRLKKSVFGPIESARNERLSAKLLEIASQPKPERQAEEEISMEGVEEASKDAAKVDDSAMDIDTKTKSVTASKGLGRKKIGRRTKRSSIVFPKYKDRVGAKKRK